MRYTIGSFNVKNLADGEGRDLDRISRIIKQSGMDVVVLQEVLQEGKVLKGIQLNNPAGQAKAYQRSLLSRLGSNWDCRFLQPTIRKEHEMLLGGDRRGEGYAVIWNTSKLSLVADEKGRDNPRLGVNYTPEFANSRLQLIREPLCVRLKVVGRPVELRLITTHIIYGKPKSTDGVIDEGAAELRRNEFRILAGQIYQRVAENYKTITATSPYTIMLGDYNLNLNSSEHGLYPRLPDIMFFDNKGRQILEESNAKFTIYTYQSDKSTLKRDEAGLANSFDHCSFNEKTKKVANGIRVVDAIKPGLSLSDKTDEDYFVYKEKVSDHLPIIVEVNI